MNADTAKYIQQFHDAEPEVILQALAAMKEERDRYASQVEDRRNLEKEMAREYQEMKTELENLRKENERLTKALQHQADQNVLQKETLFGKQTEKSDVLLNQEEKEETKDPLSEDASDDADQQTSGNETKEKSASQGAGTSTTDKAEIGNGSADGKHKNSGKTGRTGRRTKGQQEKENSNLPSKTRFDFDFDELNQKYGEGNWRFVHWHCHIQKKIVRSYAYIEKTYTPVISSGTEHVMTTMPAPITPIPKSQASPSLLAFMFDRKTELGLTYSKQEAMFLAMGVRIPRQNMTVWAEYCSENIFSLVFEYLCNYLRNKRYNQCDETYLSIIHGREGHESTGYFWVHTTGGLLEGPRVIVFCFELSRGRKHLDEFYGEHGYQGVITSDCYGAYGSFAKDSEGDVKASACWMHARRRWANAIKVMGKAGSDQQTMEQQPEVRGFNMIREIYHEESTLIPLTAEERYQQRQAKVKPLVDHYFEYIKGFDLEDGSLSERCVDAISYSLNHEPALTLFLTDGNIPIDNGFCERAIRPFATARKSFMFCNTPRGAESLGTLYTISETARANGADPYYYFQYLLEKIPPHLSEKNLDFLKDMVPWSEAYKAYEQNQREEFMDMVQEKEPPKAPKTPKKKDNTASAAVDKEATA